MKINYTEPSVLSVLAIIWQLPQAVIGALIALFGVCFCKDRDYSSFETNKIGVFELRMNLTDRFKFCFSTGPFIITPYRVSPNIMLHESGHSVQSLYLGPLYLIVVGIPSMILIAFKKAFKKSDDWYHSHYPESWADKLAGVK